MFGTATLTDDVVRSASEGGGRDLDRLLMVIQPQLRLMVAARLGPSRVQLEAIEEITQGVLLALAEGISRLQNQTVGGLKAFASRIAARRVADFLKRSDEGKAAAGLASSLPCCMP